MSSGPTAETLSERQRLDAETAFDAPVLSREIVALVALVVLADAGLYHGVGFTGPAAVLALAPLLLFLGSAERKGRFLTPSLYLLLLLLAASLAWCGNGAAVAMGAALLMAFAMSLVGISPGVLDVGIFGFVTMVTGTIPFLNYFRSLNRTVGGPSRSFWLRFGLPLAVASGFALIFLFANPHESRAFFDGLKRLLNEFWETLRDYFPPATEFLFWLGAAILSAGLLRPFSRVSIFDGAESAAESASPEAEAPLWVPYRNTLVAVIALFAAYLVFEFASLWGRTFPKGFYYAGYAHEGAAWLTAALALATIVLSVIFQPNVVRDPRLPALRRLAWIWSIENVLLAVAVYHRLTIYVGFNGMTRMRTIGFLGTTAVVGGFVLVVWKITHNRGFIWLIQRQMWALAVAVFCYVVLPVDLLVHTYNVRRILQGDLAPAVQISVHPIDTGGLVALRPLLGCDDDIIRTGVGALLAEREAKLGASASPGTKRHWTEFQLAERVLWRQMSEAPVPQSLAVDRAAREAALRRFHDYAYQWY